MCLDQVIKGSTEVTDYSAKSLVYVIVVSPVFFQELDQGHKFKNVAPNTLRDLGKVAIDVSVS